MEPRCIEQIMSHANIYVVIGIYDVLVNYGQVSGQLCEGGRIVAASLDVELEIIPVSFI